VQKRKLKTREKFYCTKGFVRVIFISSTAQVRVCNMANAIRFNQHKVLSYINTFKQKKLKTGI